MAHGIHHFGYCVRECITAVHTGNSVRSQKDKVTLVRSVTVFRTPYYMAFGFWKHVLLITKFWRLRRPPVCRYSLNTGLIQTALGYGV